MEVLQLVSIALEFVIVVLSLMIGISKKRVYGYGLALTFGVYVFYDLARLFSLGIDEAVLYAIFFIATVSALVSVWKLYGDL